MRAVLTAASVPPRDWKSAGAEWWPIALGLLVLYVPTFHALADSLWQTEEQAHGPLILAVVLYLFWRARAPLLLEPPRALDTLPGGLVLAFGLLCYVLGRSQEIWLFEIASLAPVLLGIVLLTRGRQALSALWFPILFSLFMVPLPGVAVDVATGPLKQLISALAESVLYHLGYPVGRSGVTLVIGPYHLLVADACSGLRSMFSLSALGVLYLYVMQHRGVWRNALLIGSILPIAFAANAVRVILLVLITYHFGDEAGRGFLHGFAGLVLFAAALLCLMALDGALAVVWKSDAAPAPISGGPR